MNLLTEDRILIACDAVRGIICLICSLYVYSVFRKAKYHVMDGGFIYFELSFLTFAAWWFLSLINHVYGPFPVLELIHEEIIPFIVVILLALGIRLKHQKIKRYIESNSGNLVKLREITKRIFDK